jgi:hypothetical protein
MKKMCFVRGVRLWSVVLLALVAGPRVGEAQITTYPSARGAVGLGTYATVAQFKDLRVVAGDKVLVEKSLAEGLLDLEVVAGQWKVVDGVLQQSGTESKGVHVITGDANWTDYTASVKARKLSGKEGFLLLFRRRDAKNFAVFNVGGWDNTKAQIGITIAGTHTPLGDFTPMEVEEGRWYDVKVEVKGDDCTGYVDGNKVAHAKLEVPKAGTGTNPPTGAAGRSGTPPTVRVVTNPPAATRDGTNPPATPRVATNPPANNASGGAAEKSSPVLGESSEKSSDPASLVRWGVAAAGITGLLVAGGIMARRRFSGKGG